MSTTSSEFDSDHELVQKAFGSWRFCDVCKSITLEALMSAEGFEYPERDLPETTKDDPIKCWLCYNIQGSNTLISTRRLRVEAKQHGASNDSTACVARLYLTKAEGYRDGEWGKIEGWKEVEKLVVMTLPNDPAVQLGIPAAYSDLSCTNSRSTFGFIRDCLIKCLSDHKDCANSIISKPGGKRTSNTRPKSTKNAKSKSTHQSHAETKATQWPARLIKISSRKDVSETPSDAVLEPFHIKLVTIGRRCPNYVALSHCWGQAPLDARACSTTKSNLGSREQHIPLRELTPTFCDAMEIAYRVGVRHIWIDSLCIVQDSSEDWATEAAKMWAIYANAVVTVSASRSENSYSGCFNNASKPHWSLDPEKSGKKTTNREVNRPFLFGLTVRTITGERSSLVFQTLPSFYRRLDEELLPLASSPLHRRGWIMQERILPSRIVHFAETQVVWECRSRHLLEDRYEAISGEDAMTVPKLVTAFATKSSRSKLVGAKEWTIEPPFQFWYEELVSTNYSRRLFTQAENRLIAIAGVARVMAQAYPDQQYLAGLWKSDLAYGLLWQHRREARTHHPEEIATCQSNRRLTWTWTQHDGPIWWPHKSHELGMWPAIKPDSNFSLVKVDLCFNESPAQPFGLANSGFIVVRGVVLDIPAATGTGRERDFECNGKAAKVFYDHDDASLWKVSALGIILCQRDQGDESEETMKRHGGFLASRRMLFLAVQSYFDQELGLDGYVRVGTGYVEYTQVFGLVDPAEIFRQENMQLVIGGPYRIEEVRLF